MTSLPSHRTEQPGLRLDRIARTKRTALLLPVDLPLDIWKRIGEQISVISDASAWWIGDWLLFGKDKYPDRYKRAIEETSLDYQTLRNYAWVASRFGMSRRRDKLSFQHHVEVTALPVEQQDLWLDRAERSGWSRNELRSRIRNRHCKGTAALARLQLSISEECRQTWQDAASKARVDLIEWISKTLDRAAHAELETPDAAPINGTGTSIVLDG